jgi:hypothetical protein
MADIDIKLTREELEKHGLPFNGSEDVEIVHQGVIAFNKKYERRYVIFKWLDGKCYKTQYEMYQGKMNWLLLDRHDKIVCSEVEKVVETTVTWLEVSRFSR